MAPRALPALLALLATFPLVNCAPLSPDRNAVLVKPKVPPPLPSPPLPEGPPPVIFAESAIVVDAMTGRILAAKNPDSPRAVASTQKLMTALLVMEGGSLDKVVTIQASDGRVEPTKLYLKPGEQYTRRELLKVIMVKSANDVSMALARDVAGSKEAFAQRMTARARSLGMNNSQFQNPHGLTEPNQYSTARDLSILARKVYPYTFLRQCMRTRKFTFTYNDGRTKTVESTNKLLDRLSYVTGMKTGTTNAAGRCLVSSGSLNGRVVIAVVLKSNTANVWNDSEKLMRWALETSPRAAIPAN